MLSINHSEEFVSSKQPWSTPALTELKADLIRQQEEELLYYALNSEEFFRLVSGTASDYRLKEDKKDFDALSVVNAISAYDFAWKETGEREYGFMAHEIQQVMPYLVSGQKDQIDQHGQPMIQRVNYAKLTPVLIKAIQQQQQMIESLQQQLQELAGAPLSK
ncbi:MAG: tail fiber domain-containing protein [Sphingomonadales bacterium]|nr:tail fiber domain-containing protein [Sphingomonadales bacterium]